MKTLYLCGAGNPDGVRLAMIVNREEPKWDRLVVLDDDPARHGQELLGAPIAGGIEEMLAKADPSTDNVVNLIARSTATRRKVRNKILATGIPFAQLIHPGVETLGVTFGGADVTVYENATLCANSTIGEGSVVFMNAVIGHGATVKQGAVVGPGAVLNARVVLSDLGYFGTNASILPDLTIGEAATVGANSAVVADVPAKATAIGVPAQVLMTAESARSLEDAGSSQLGKPDEETAQAIKEVWQEVLGVSEIAANANFFDLGGTSLLALQLTKRTQEVVGKPVALLDVFRFPTIELLAAHLSDNSGNGRGASVGAKRAEQRRKRRLAQRPGRM
jgi:serine acetyltransferase